MVQTAAHEPPLCLQPHLVMCLIRGVAPPDHPDDASMAEDGNLALLDERGQTAFRLNME